MLTDVQAMNLLNRMEGSKPGLLLGTVAQVSGYLTAAKAGFDSRWFSGIQSLSAKAFGMKTLDYSLAACHQHGCASGVKALWCSGAVRLLSAQI